MENKRRGMSVHEADFRQEFFAELQGIAYQHQEQGRTVLAVAQWPYGKGDGTQLWGAVVTNRTVSPGDIIAKRQPWKFGLQANLARVSLQDASVDDMEQAQAYHADLYKTYADEDVTILQPSGEVSIRARFARDNHLTEVSLKPRPGGEDAEGAAAVQWLARVGKIGISTLDN